MLYNQNPKLALIIIGDEILSGRTLDKNTQYIAQKVAPHGIELKEIRVIPDDQAEIINTVNALRKKYDYVFTTGGIGPTHDDITTESVAKAFGVELEKNAVAEKLLFDYYGGDENLNPGRVKMMMIPKGAALIDNPVSVAPGFIIENVFVMAGVPKIMQAMLEDVIPKLRTGEEVKSKTIRVETGESKIAGVMAELQNKYNTISIGSYPYMMSEGFNHNGANIVFRSTDQAAIKAASDEFMQKLTTMKITFEDK